MLRAEENGTTEYILAECKKLAECLETIPLIAI